MQAQKEISKLTAAEPSETPEANSSEAGPSEESSTSSEQQSTLEASTSEASTSSNATQTLLSRLQSVVPPNVIATVQNNIPESLKHASENIDLQQIRSNLLSEFQRVQGVTLAQAEEYAHKSEALLREAVKEAGEALREAVKVIPPDQAGPSGGSTLMWDGTDMWMLPSEPGEPSSAGKDKEGSSSKGLESQSAVASRAEALLRRLKHDPEIIRHDPEAEDGVKEQYLAWKQQEVDSLDGGTEGSTWNAKINAALQDSTDGPALKELESTLGKGSICSYCTIPANSITFSVPSEISREAFWLRFFFRTYQIRTEEEKRKALIQSMPLIRLIIFIFTTYPPRYYY